MACVGSATAWVEQETSVSQANPSVVVIGAGLAGLTVALELARRGPVLVLAKRDIS
ncbi:MAG TPA: FAD-dependent oxidoreductase, partial [Burkholderiaceae bacterium]|nr:FAD-dependent oxidoreductase [Burkholderiaceae bacterium]